MFEGKTAVITGASSGLGRQLSIELSKNNCNLVLASRNVEELKVTAGLCKKNNISVSVVPTDITNPDDCKNIIEVSKSKFHRIDYLILNAGISMWAKFDEITDLNLFKKLMEVNYLGAVYLTYYSLPLLKLSNGLITVISSIQGIVPVPYHTGYAASKHALLGFFNTLRIELKNDGVDVLTVIPHWLRGTNLRNNALDKGGNLFGKSNLKHTKESVTLEECAEGIIDSMKKRKREFVIPSKLKLLSIINTVSPKTAEKIISSKVNDQE